MIRHLAPFVVTLAIISLQPTVLEAAAVPCVGGAAGIYACDGVDLLAQVPLASLGGGSGNDIWGWTDPLTGREYALMGRTNGTAMVDISDPENPVYVGNLPTQTTSSSWRDIKVFSDHAFVVADNAGSHGIQIFDLTKLRNVPSPPATFTADALYSGFGSAHNIAINEATGFAYAVDTGTCSNGLHMVDVNNPTSPVFAGCHSADGAIHDAQCVSYQGPDLDHQGSEVCFTATLTGDTMDIIDVTNKSATVTLSSNSYPGAVTPHQGWLTEDHRYFLHGDESDESSFGHNTRTYVFDVSDLDNPILVGNYTAGLPAIDHNQYVRGGFVYQANYTSGLRILDLTGIATASLTQSAFFDTRPENNITVFEGAWSVYPFFGSCSVIVSDIQRGLFVLRPSTLCVCGNGIREGSEECEGIDFGGATCGDFDCTGGSLTCNSSCEIELASCTGCTQCDFDGLCEVGEDCTVCPSDCPSLPTGGASCGNGICEAGAGDDENCLTCPADCDGTTGGKPANRFCCGFGDGLAPNGCGASQCTSGGFMCTETPVGGGGTTCCGDSLCEPPEDGTNCALDCGTGPVCGDSTCDPGEDTCSCPADCGAPPASELPNFTCQDGIDNDCGGGVDCADTDCASDPACVCGGPGASCNQNGDCCSNRCKGNGTCK